MSENSSYLPGMLPGNMQRYGNARQSCDSWSNRGRNPTLAILIFVANQPDSKARIYFLDGGGGGGIGGT